MLNKEENVYQKADQVKSSLKPMVFHVNMVYMGIGYGMIVLIIICDQLVVVLMMMVPLLTVATEYRMTECNGHSNKSSFGSKCSKHIRIFSLITKYKIQNREHRTTAHVTCNQGVKMK